MKLASWLLVIAVLAAATAAGAQETVGRYAGVSSIDGEPPFKTFLEIHRSGTAISGHLEIPGQTFVVEDARADGNHIRGKLVGDGTSRSEEHTSELQSQSNLVCRLLLEKK